MARRIQIEEARYTPQDGGAKLVVQALVEDNRVGLEGEELTVVALGTTHGPFTSQPNGRIREEFDIAVQNADFPVVVEIPNTGIRTSRNVQVPKLTRARTIEMRVNPTIANDTLTITVRTSDASGGQPVNAALPFLKNGLRQPDIRTENGFALWQCPIAPRERITIKIVPSNGRVFEREFRNLEHAEEGEGVWYFHNRAANWLFGLTIVFTIIIFIASIARLVNLAGAPIETEATLRYRELVTGRPALETISWGEFPTVWVLNVVLFVVAGILMLISRVDDLRRWFWRRDKARQEEESVNVERERQNAPAQQAGQTQPTSSASERGGWRDWIMHLTMEFVGNVLFEQIPRLGRR